MIFAIEKNVIIPAKSFLSVACVVMVEREVAVHGGESDERHREHGR